MLTLRQRIFVIIGIAVGLILAIVFSLLYRKSIENQGLNNSEQSEDVVNLISDNVNGIQDRSFDQQVDVNQVVKSKVASDEIYVKQLATIFVERFASFSNQNNNRHIEDVLVLTTPKMSSWVKSQVLEQDKIYKGSSTRVVASSVREKNDNLAIVEINVQQVLSYQLDNSNDLSEEIVQKKGRIELAKIDKEWKVNGFWWE